MIGGRATCALDRRASARLESVLVEIVLGGHPNLAGIPILVASIMGFLIASLTLFAMLFKHRLFFHDDAFISLRYARNLAEHGQITWNLG